MSVGTANTRRDWSHLTVGMPKRHRLWMRWLEPVENILANAWTCDMSGDWRSHLENYFKGNVNEVEYLAEHGEGPIPQWTPNPSPNMPFDHKAYAEYRAEYESWFDRNAEFIEAHMNAGDGIQFYSEYEDDYIQPPFTRQNCLLRLLDNKRGDEHYDDVVESLDKNGFLRPLTARPAKYAPFGYESGDGHHRLAAAIDLGFTHIPLQWSPNVIAGDSGEWRSGDRVYRSNRKI